MPEIVLFFLFFSFYKKDSCYCENVGIFSLFLGITGIFFAKGKRKDQKDQFLAYNMSLFLKEENGRLVLRYIIYFAKVLLLKRKNCESCYATKLDVKVAKA